jgi:NADPH2:quinone reductase
MDGLNQGDDITGTVHAVGSNVTEFPPSDRVAGFHAVAKPAGRYAEYAHTRRRT